MPNTTTLRRLAPVAGLFLLAPWAAECSWGGFTATDFPAVLIFLGPLYGGAAIGIREIARRTGGGWPAIILLAAAFGVLQAGLIDQSLFNRDYLADTQYADLGRESATTLVPGLGISAGQAFDFVSNHIWLSIATPIALVEAFGGAERRHRPWLGGRGLAGVGVLFLLGAALIFSDDSGRKGFLAGPVQLGFAAALVVALVGAALLPRWRRTPPADTGWVPPPLLFGAGVLAAHLGFWFAIGWAGVGVRASAVLAGGALVVVWSRRAGWGPRHVVAGWSAGLVAAAGGAYLVPTYAPASPAEAVVGDVTVSVVTLLLVVGAYARVSPRRGSARPPVPGS
jgi:hypothetical protein